MARPSALPVTGVDFHTAVRSQFFLLVTLAFVFVMASQVGGISHLVKLATGRVDKPTASLVLSVMAAASVVARLAGGWIVTRVPMVAFTAALAALQGLSLLALAWIDSRTGLLVMAAVFGITIGNLIMLQPLLMAEAFGVRDYARIYSRSQFVSTLGVALGPLLLGLVHDGVSGYELPYAAGRHPVVGRGSDDHGRRSGRAGRSQGRRRRRPPIRRCARAAWSPPPRRPERRAIASWIISTRPSATR